MDLRPTAIVICSYAGYLLLLLPQVAAQPQAMDPEPKDVAIAVWDRSTTKLTSGRGSGSYTVQKQATAPGALQSKVSHDKYNVRIWFSSPKFRIELSPDEATAKAGASAYSVIYDGQHFARKETSKRLKPHGEEIRVFASPDGNLRALNDTGTFPFRFNPCRLPSHVAPLGNFMTKAKDLLFTYEADKSIKGTCAFPADPSMRCLFTFAAENKQNLSRYQLLDRNGKLVQEATAQWHTHNDIHYVQSLSLTNLLSSINQSQCYALMLDQFEANAPIDPSLFTLQSLGLKPGVRILDLNHDTKTMTQYSIPSQTGKIVTKSIRDSLQQFPVTHINVNDPPQTPQKQSRRLLFLIAAALAAIATALVLYRGYRHRRSRQESALASKEAQGPPVIQDASTPSPDLVSSPSQVRSPDAV